MPNAFDPGDSGDAPYSPPINDNPPPDSLDSAYSMARNADEGYMAAPTENSPEDSFQQFPIQYQQDTGYVPNSRDLGITATQAGNFVSPPDYFSAQDAQEQESSSGLFSGLGTLVRGATDVIGGALEKDRQTVEGGLGNLVAAYFPGSPQDLAYRQKLQEIINDPRNQGADWTDWRQSAQAMMEAGRSSWDAVPDVPVLKGAVEAAVDPANLAFAGAGELAGAARGGAEALKAGAPRFLGEESAMGRLDLGLTGKSIKEITSPIAAGAHATDVAYLKELGDRVVGGTATPEDLGVLKAAAKRADALEASGDAAKASDIRQALGIESGPERGTPLTGEADKGFVPNGPGAYPGTALEKALASGGDQSRAGLADRLTEASGGTSQATTDLNTGLAKTIGERQTSIDELARQNGLTKNAEGLWEDTRGNTFTDEAVRNGGVNGFYGPPVDTTATAGKAVGQDVKESAETTAAMKERDTALKASGQKYEDLTPGAQARLDNMFGVSKMKDPEMNALDKVLAPLSNVSNAMRTAMTSWDLSMGRQAGGLIGGAPGSVAKGIAAQFPAMKMTATEFRDATAKILAEVDAAGGRKLAIGGPGSFQEEKYLGSHGSLFGKSVEDIPGVAGSEQAYTHGLNVARADAYLTGIKTMEDSAGRALTQEEKDQFASHINHLTGRGDIPKGLEGAFKAINGVFFAPRYRLSRAEVATDFANSAIGVIKDIGGAIKNGEPIVLNPVDKKVLEMTSKYFASIESTMRAAQVAEHLMGRDNTYSDVGAPGPLGGQEDPTSTTFGKLDVGAPGSPGAVAAGAGEFVGLGTQSYAGKDQTSETVKVDPWSGFAPELRTAFREFKNLQGLWSDITGGNKVAGAHQVGSDLAKYGREGLAPLANLEETVRTGENAIGQKVGPTDYASPDFQRNPVLSSTIPLAFQGALQDTGLPYPGKEGPAFGPSTGQPGEDLQTGGGAGFGSRGTTGGTPTGTQKRGFGR